ncbi:T9SS type A sorting domain-containing protein [Flavisolibacter tropicus]|uniref:Secretion system C-terminal sorting domain-containing protein n=1 Tax=Flavisolibacter tropicus TaxID=1492898 RepID=A0A172U0M7_9BACT|nr:T9SS type A sorting domain-containing protein [Flavisolibacter tropicus]ANE52911.1 hypothetical protein SY85_22950 [Flavisolibacter tropicus]
MKKFNLTIPKPCHENWDQMTPEDKGRFCGSCQKTVVDFTNMSDRELAAFFKKSVGSVCGRFHQDQLNREITVPKKRIPWLRYFFHIAWPAFIVMLKSCGPKDRVVGDVVPDISLSNGGAKENLTTIVTMGMPLSVPEENIPPPPVAGKVVASEEFCAFSGITGDVVFAPIDSVEGIDTTAYVLYEDCFGIGVEIDSAVVADTTISNYDQDGIDTIISVAPIKTDKEPAAHLVTDTNESEVHSVIAYPNPSRAGSILNLKFAEKEFTPVSIQLLTSGGQRVVHKMLGKSDYSMPCTLQLPSNLTSGIYFIQVLYANGSKDKATVMVSQ